jgi:hypothetical protein
MTDDERMIATVRRTPMEKAQKSKEFIEMLLRVGFVFPFR